MWVVSRREDRLPRPVRDAIRALEVVFVSGTDQEYAQALTRLGAASAGLGERQREKLGRTLSAARERAESLRHLAKLRAALGGPWTHVAHLPGGVELVRLTGAADDELLVTAPARQGNDSPAVVELVEHAREALAAGHCARCGAVLSYRADGQAGLVHGSRCPLGEDRINRARARTVTT